MNMPVQNDRTAEELTPIPEKCPHCGSFARYEASKEMVDGKHLYGLTTWECGFAFQRTRDEEFDRPVEFEPGRCRRTPL